MHLNFVLYYLIHVYLFQKQQGWGGRPSGVWLPPKGVGVIPGDVGGGAVTESAYFGLVGIDLIDFGLI